ncbi:MAG: hypothetical protein ACSLE1_20815, partial [Sphingobium sp.]
MSYSAPMCAMIAFALALGASAASSQTAPSSATAPATPAAVVAQAAASAWRDIPADELLVMTIE